jgi:NADPH:quinone reductase-like Zn-dependent oxidoreductase
MKAAQIVEFGPPSVITNDDLPRPEPGPGQLLVRVKAAGVGNWDALIREGKVRLHPLTANSNRYRATQTATTDELRFLDETA